MNIIESKIEQTEFGVKHLVFIKGDWEFIKDKKQIFFDLEYRL